MTRATAAFMSAGVALFAGILVSQGLPGVLATLSLAGWGLLGVALFHALPLLLDAAAIRVLFPGAGRGATLRESALTRWVGESANSLMPAGQLGGPVLMARHLAALGMSMKDAAASITVSTTLQSFAQIAFALAGVVLLGARASDPSDHTLRTAALISSAVLAVQVGGFYLVQRRGFFHRLTRAAQRLYGARDWSRWLSQAESIDEEVEVTYRRTGAVGLSFSLSLVGWVVGTGEVFRILGLMGYPVDWAVAFLLESLGQAIRGAGFAIPGALGVQEGGYLLLAPLAGLSPEVALALSLAKRTRELLLGVPGLIYLQFSGRAAAAARPAPPTDAL